MQAMHGPHRHPNNYRDQLEVEDLLTVGPVHIHGCGEENMYFVSVLTGVWHFVKCF